MTDGERYPWYLNPWALLLLVVALFVILPWFGRLRPLIDTYERYVRWANGQ